MVLLEAMVDHKIDKIVFSSNWRRPTENRNPFRSKKKTRHLRRIPMVGNEARDGKDVQMDE